MSEQPPQPLALQPPRLTAAQTRALFDILTHNETYAEIVAFKYPQGVLNYGYPFHNKEQARAEQRQTPEKNGTGTTSQKRNGSVGGVSGFAARLWGRSGSSSTTPTSSAPDTDQSPPSEALSTVSLGQNGSASDGSSGKDGPLPSDQSEMPILQLLMSTFVMQLPAISTLSGEFWEVRLRGLLSRFADARLSESYEKGTMGARKTLATGWSSVMEMLSRGMLGGVKPRQQHEHVPEENQEKEAKQRKYDVAKGQDLTRAWEDVLDGLVYGDLVDELFAHMARQPELEEYSSAVNASSHYIVIHLAALLHHVFVETPDGPYLIKLIDNVHRLVPYAMIKQTLRIGNAATMINGLMHLLLAKLSVTGLTNWVGLTANEDDGMNLLQNIISLVLSRDASEFKKILQRIERMSPDSTTPTEAMLKALRAHVNSNDRATEEALRKKSLENPGSIVVAILNAQDPELVKELGKTQHLLCLEYYSALLSVRDRTAITAALCRQPPDLFTGAIREAVAAYNPIIRAVHERVDLGDHLQDLQVFITDFIRVSTPAPGGPGVTVDDYVRLLSDKKHLLHRFLHAVASSCPDITNDLCAWSNASIAKFRQTSAADGAANADENKASTMDKALNQLVSTLGDECQAVLSAVDAHAGYLANMQGVSDVHLDHIASRTAAGKNKDGHDDKAQTSGPGIYLARWQNLLDETVITTAKKYGSIRHGSDVRHHATKGKTGLAGHNLSTIEKKKDNSGILVAPDVSAVVNALEKPFHELMKVLNAERTAAM
ncbi:hypothetical protein LEL_09941 [Akanthomyces lecanii RCEF 1005]|uniref:Px domain containing protein n=1 Tax=Akanthomyces lecanii RCEF 1005 TaxID=1081108 RepID=A0A168BHJ3_CORDF|nr:hypothetical protein LEL_09941 [Akanthomyces lecanii RCEF 1005]